MAAIALLAPQTGAGLAARQGPPQPPTPSFRASSDVVRLDVTVLDKDRRPVRGLTAADFRVFEDGRAQPVVVVTPVDLPSLEAEPPAASWVENAPHDVIRNTGSREGRLVVIAFDWSVRFMDQATARRLAHAVIDNLGPADQAAVLFTRPNSGAGAPQNFTSDRALLRAAVDRPFAAAETEPPPKENLLVDPEGYTATDCHCRTCSMEALARVAGILKGVQDRPKAIMLITSFVRAQDIAPPVRITPPPLGQFATTHTEIPGACAVPLDTSRRKFELAAAGANAVVHVLDAVGLETQVTSPLGSARRIAERQASIPVLADMTGGRAVRNTNAPETQVAAVLAESSSYYILGFTPGAPAGDQRAHRIEVRTTRRDVTVLARDSYRRVEATASTVETTDPGLVRTVGGVLSARDLALEASVVPMLSRAGRQPVAVVIGRLLEGAASAATPGNGAPTVTMLTAAFTPFGRAVGSKRRTVELSGAGTSMDDRGRRGLLSLMPLAPGRYEMRVGAEVSTREAGSVHTFIEVPDFARDRLSVSGVLLNVQPPDVIDPPDEVALLPAVPTARRDFARNEPVSAVFQISQGVSRTDALQPVTARWRITNAMDTDVLTGSVVLAPADFGDRMTEPVIALPLDRLAPGPHLLRISVAGPERAIERTVRFDVR